MGRVEGKVAFVTGGAHGQGRSHALRLAEEGADIVIVDVCAPINADVPYAMGTHEELMETARMVEERDRRCVARVADARDVNALKEAVAAGVVEFGHIDIAVINHGIITFALWDEISEQAWDDVLDVNLKGVWNTFKAVVPPMREAQRGGSIIVTSSSAGIRGQLPYVHYVASKHGVVGLTRSMANTLARYRIRVNSVHPTGVAFDTTGRKSDSFMGTGDSTWMEPLFVAEPMFVASATNVFPDLNAPFEDSTPLAMLEPVDISNAVLFLASDEARYITGIQLPVDAGNSTKP